MRRRIPELLAPAGDMERLEMALHYGADAVYLAGKEFGMRAAAGNFSDDELRHAAKICHDTGVRVYVAINTLPHENELSNLPGYLEFISDCKADAVIVSDLGVLSLSKKYAPNTDIHISTQFGVLNSESAKALFDMGAKRIILARELSLENIAVICSNIPEDLEVEAFVHGAMCVSFSGRCLLSNYLTGRDANSGECAQPCRWKYHLVEEQRPGEYMEITEDGGTHIFNSRDMCMIEHIPELIDAGVTSLKIEGRMKSAYYAAITTNAYRHAVDAAIKGEPLSNIWLEEVNKCSHRQYSTGFYFGEPGQYYPDSMYFSDADVCAVVESCDENNIAMLTQRNKFSVGETVELVTNRKAPYRFTVGEILDIEGNPLSSAPHPMMPIIMKMPFSAPRLSILRKLK